MTAKDVAALMWDSLSKRGVLVRTDAIDICRRYGADEYIYYNDNDGPRISEDVLTEFKRLHGGRADYNLGKGRWDLLPE